MISAENAAALRTMLEAVVVAAGRDRPGGRDQGLPGRRQDRHRQAGQRTARYADGEVGSFIGMAPADAPRYVIAVFAHTPGGNGGVGGRRRRSPR